MLPNVLIAAQPPAAETEIRMSAERMVQALNSARVDKVLELFLPEGELVDEAGTVYRGHDELQAVLAAYFERFPGAKTELQLEAIRVLGPVAIEEGTRTTTTADGKQQVTIRYIAVRTRTNEGWPLASVREFLDESALTSHDQLQTISWLLGEWLNEGSDGRVKIDYHWSDDGNYLLGDYLVMRESGTPLNTSQRIGWDPSIGKFRSWVFDSDGGFAEGIWTPTDEGWVIKSTAVMPDGRTGSATLTLLVQDPTRFVMKGTDRIVGNRRETDFELTVVKQPPKAGQ
jgi:uncharacterized protein (TIGR02246 family)